MRQGLSAREALCDIPHGFDQAVQVFLVVCVGYYRKSVAIVRQFHIYAVVVPEHFFKFKTRNAYLVGADGESRRVYGYYSRAARQFGACAGRSGNFVYGASCLVRKVDGSVHHGRSVHGHFVAGHVEGSHKYVGRTCALQKREIIFKKLAVYELALYVNNRALGKRAGHLVYALNNNIRALLNRALGQLVAEIAMRPVSLVHH